MGALQAFCQKTMYSDSKGWYLDAYLSRVSENAEGNFQIRARACAWLVTAKIDPKKQSQP
jgi:hypothetical protein